MGRTLRDSDVVPAGEYSWRLTLALAPPETIRAVGSAATHNFWGKHVVPEGSRATAGQLRAALIERSCEEIDISPQLVTLISFELVS